MTALLPFPSLIRASALDAGNASMRKACRAQWNEDDWNVMCATQDRLVRSLYGRSGDHNQPDMCFLRFQTAEVLERQGKLKTAADLEAVLAYSP